MFLIVSAKRIEYGHHRHDRSCLVRATKSAYGVLSSQRAYPILTYLH